MFRKNTEVTKQTRFLFSITILRQSCLLWDYVEKYCRGEQGTDDETAHAHCVLDN